MPRSQRVLPLCYSSRSSSVKRNGDKLKRTGTQMYVYEVVVRLSQDFRRTCFFVDEDTFAKAHADGCYFQSSFTVVVEATSHTGAAEVVFEICNSSDDEMHCAERYRPQVRAYRKAGNRSLSSGDVLEISDLDGSPHDGLYGCAMMGWERV